MRNIYVEESKYSCLLFIYFVLLFLCVSNFYVTLKLCYFLWSKSFMWLSTLVTCYVPKFNVTFNLSYFSCFKSWMWLSVWMQQPLHSLLNVLYRICKILPSQSSFSHMRRLLNKSCLPNLFPIFLWKWFNMDVPICDWTIQNVVLSQMKL